MKKFLKWLIPCLVACFMVVGLVQTASFTFATTGEGQTEIVGSSDDLNAGNSNEGSDTDVEGNPEESSEDEPEVDENTSEENLEGSEVGPEGTVSNARIMSLSDNGQVSNDFQPKHSKTVSKIPGDDDDYLLSLSVIGNSQTVEGALPEVDVVLVVDTSGSMNDKIYQYTRISFEQLGDYSDDIYAEYYGTKYKINKDNKGYYIRVGIRRINIIDNNYPLYFLDQSKTQTKREALKNAVANSTDGLSNAILNNPKINAQMAVVTFNTVAEIKQNWTKNVSEINSAMPSNETDGGTNYQDGLIKTKTVLEKARKNSQKYVIFLSDGQPTYRIVNGQVVGSGGSDILGLDARAAYTEASSIVGLTGFYTIGFGIEEDIDAQGILDTLKDSPNCAKRGSFLANDTSSLIEVFNSILADITTTYFNSIKIEDVLSDNVDLTSQMGVDDKGNLTGYEFKVTDSKGNPVQDSGITIDKLKVTYETENKTVKIEFPSDYVLKDGYTYTVSFKIEPNEDAYNEYVKTGKYPNTGDPYTGVSSANQDGFFSNKEAKLYYKVSTNGTSGEEQSSFYAKPVVQINMVNIPVTKNWIDADQNPIEVKKEEIDDGIVIVSLIANSKVFKTANVTIQDGIWKGEFTDVPMKPDGSYPKYTLSDEVDGFTVSESDSSVTKNVNGDYSATITNKKNPTLTITKNVTGAFGDKTASFDIEVFLYDKNNEPIEKIGTEELENGKLTVTLKDGKSKTFTLPFGTKYKVKETSESSTGYSVSYTVDGENKTFDDYVSLNNNDKVVVTNKRDAAPITGIIDNTPKGLGLIGSIVVEIAAIAFVLKKKRQLKM